MTNRILPFLSAALISTCLISPQALAQNAPADLSVRTTTTTVQDGNPDTPPVTQENTVVSVPPRTTVSQGAPVLHTVNPANYPPVTDPDSQLMYVSGGVGEAEIAYFKTLHDDYTFKLLMADKAGHLVGDATVVIADAHDKTIATLNGVGPYLLVKLPAGKYKVTATANGAQVLRNIVVKADKITAIDARF